MGLLFCLSISHLLFLCERFQFKCSKFIWQDVWSLGCQHNGLHLCCSDRQPAASFDVQFNYKVALHQCWRKHFGMVYIHFHILWHYDTIWPTGGFRFFPFLLLRILFISQKFPIKYLSHWRSQGFYFQENVFFVIYVLMSTFYFYLTLALVPIVALLGDFIYQG